MGSLHSDRPFWLENNLYCLTPPAAAEFPPQSSRHLGNLYPKRLPLTVINWAKGAFDDQDLNSTFDTFSARDDVWSPGFSSTIILLLPPNLACKVKADAAVLTISISDLQLANGPYVLCQATHQIFSVCRLYHDTHHAFVGGILPQVRTTDDFQPLSLQPTQVGLDHPGISTPELTQIPVPSRLYYTPCRRKPLAGLRIAVKDVVCLQGLKTGFGNNAWQETYPPAKTTAPAITLLIEAGAVIVGKVKTSEFSEGVDPHQWVGSTCPVNPRGDGEQKPSSSSTGSAVATAAYSWLDCSIGTDTGGSIRHPAGVNGLFGNRPTHAAIDLSGVYGATDLLNTLGLFARDASTFSKIGSQLLPKSFQPLVSRSARKYKLLYPVRSPHERTSNSNRWFPSPQADPSRLTEAEKQLESFVRELEQALDCERTPVNLSELWRATKPRGHPSSLAQATGHIYSALVSYSAVRSGGIDNFIAEYAASHAGSEPAISSIVKRRFDYGRSLSTAEIAKHLDSMRDFARWVEDVLFGPVDQEAITLLIFPQSFGRENYRHERPTEDVVVYDSFSVYSFGYLVGCPDYTIPVGEVPFVSKVTGEKGYLPVSLSMVARRGKDGLLFDVLEMLEGRGTLRGVKAGRRMYGG